MENTTITLNFEKINEIDFSLFQKLNKFGKFVTDCSKNQVIMRMTKEQYEEALVALENDDCVNIIS